MPLQKKYLSKLHNNWWSLAISNLGLSTCVSRGVCTEATRNFCSHVVIEFTQTDGKNRQKENWNTWNRKFYTFRFENFEKKIIFSTGGGGGGTAMSLFLQ